MAYEPFHDLMDEIDRMRPDLLVLVREATSRQANRWGGLNEHTASPARGMRTHTRADRPLR